MRTLLAVLLIATAAPFAGAQDAEPDPLDDTDALELPNARSAESIRIEGLLDARPTTVVLVMAAVNVRGSDPSPLTNLLGEAGILAEDLRTVERDRDRTVYRVTGKAGPEDAVRDLVVRARSVAAVELLWVAKALVPVDAVDPVPLETIVWSPRLYPSKGSMVHVGPTGRPVYYVPGTKGDIVEGNWDGTQFRTAYYSLKKPPYIEGGGGGLNLSRMSWQWRVAGWVQEQGEIRRRGWEKYGYIFDRPAETPASPSPAPR